MIKFSTALATVLLFTQTLFAGEISGTIDASKEIKASITANGALFIFAKKPGVENQMGVPPIAVMRIPNPTFPQKFTLSEKNVMIPGTQFEGPLTISARYSPSGDALDKSGPTGTDSKKGKVAIGAKDVLIKLAK